MGTDHEVDLAGRKFSPEKLSSLVLKSLKDDAEAFLKTEVTDAVITVPAYFNDRQRKSTIAAGKIAGFNVRRIINEPTAAALAYGARQKQDRILMVLDLGGGTFDVSIVEVFEGSIEVKASSGECFLGGEDFTTAMASKILLEAGIPFERAELMMPKKVSRLIQQCEVAKRKLARESTATIRMPDDKGELDDVTAPITVTTEQFEAWTEKILQRIDNPIRRALADAGVRREAIDQILLVGGATRMPAMSRRVESYLLKTPICQINPDEVVALGAAVQAGLFAHDAMVDDLVVTDVCPFTLGINIAHRVGDQDVPGYFLPIINRNTTIPVSRVNRVQTIGPGQDNVKVEVFQGESRMVKDNLPLGEFSVRGIPPGPAGQEVDIRFTYDLNGVLEVEATIVATGKKFSHIIAHNARDLSASALRQAVKEMQALKTHPREETVNRTVLLQAERVFRELPPHVRLDFGRLIDAFESAMESNDKKAIDEFRAALQAAIDQIEGNDNFDSDWS